MSLWSSLPLTGGRIIRLGLASALKHTYILQHTQTAATWLSTRAIYRCSTPRHAQRQPVKPSSQYDAEPRVASRRVALRRVATRRVVHNFSAHARVRRTATTPIARVFGSFKVQNLRLIVKGSWRSFLCWHCICGSDGEGSVAEVCGSVVYLLDASSKESITSFFTEHEIEVHKRTWSATSFQAFSFAILSL